MKKFIVIINILILLVCTCLDWVMVFSKDDAPASVTVPSPSPTVTASPTQTPRVTATPKPTPKPTPTPTPTSKPTPTPKPTPHATPEATPYVAPLNYNGEYVIYVNRLQNRVYVYGKDKNNEYRRLVKAFICSVGKDFISETPTGEHNTTQKYVWRSLHGGTYGQYATRIYGHYLFHSVPYTSMHKDSLISSEYNKLGTAASQGCIRLTVRDAKWIYDNCRIGTRVVIYDSDKIEPYVEPVEKIDLTDSRAGWDPTDPDVNNPWSIKS
jgi:lipoprotein-anchoring transpeptidase ErfK/SrfK